MIVSELCVYPLKSGQGIKLQQARVETKGFCWDRELMLVSGSGKFITQRQFPQLAKVEIEISRQDISLKLTAECGQRQAPPFQGGEPLTDRHVRAITFASTLNGTLIEVEIWGDRLLAVDQGDEVAQWFHQLLNLPTDKVCRLVRQSPSHVRQLDRKYSPLDARPMSFADNFPVMLTATASLAELNQRIVEIHQQQIQAIMMNRFRPNIVVETIEPFVEDCWSLIQIGEVQFKITKPSSRCIITTIDQQQGEKNQLKEPLNTLGTFRQLSEQGVMFGVNMIPQKAGTIRTGDRLQVLKTR